MSPFVTGLVTTYLNTPATVKGQCRGLDPKDYIRSFTDVFRYAGRMISQVSDLPVLDLRRCFSLEPYLSLS